MLNLIIKVFGCLWWFQKKDSGGCQGSLAWYLPFQELSILSDSHFTTSKGFWKIYLTKRFERLCEDYISSTLPWMHSVWIKPYHLRFLLSWRRSGHCWLRWLYKWSLSQSSMGTSKRCHGLGSILPKVFPFFPVSTKKWTSHMPFVWLQGLSNVHSSYSFMVYRWVSIYFLVFLVNLQ